MRPPEQDYQLDDLIRDQRRQMYIAAACIGLLMLYGILGGRLPGAGPEAPPPNPSLAAPPESQGQPPESQAAPLESVR